MAREALRLRISGEKCLDELESISEELKSGETDVQRLKARADIQFSLLKKILPDLKAVEHTGDEGGAIKAALEVAFREPG